MLVLYTEHSNKLDKPPARFFASFRVFGDVAVALVFMIAFGLLVSPHCEEFEHSNAINKGYLSMLRRLAF